MHHTPEDPSGAEYYLENAEQLHEQSPDTFTIPPRAEREAAKPQDYVKLIFAHPNPIGVSHGAERMWVIITSTNNKGEYEGVLDNDPLEFTTLKAGDVVTFRPEHVIAIDPS